MRCLAVFVAAIVWTAAAQTLTPTTGVAVGSPHTFTTAGMADGDRVYFLQDHGLAAGLSCNVPPSRGLSYSRSDVHVVSGGSVEIDLAGLQGRAYKVCHKAVTDGAPGFATFSELAFGTVTLTEGAVTCPGAAVCHASPSILSNQVSGGQNVQLTGAASDDDVMLLQTIVDGIDTYDCDNLPDAALKLHSNVVAVGALGPSFDVEGITPGAYHVCRRPSGGSWERLALTIVVSGPVSPLHSRVSCCDTAQFVAERVYCHVHAKDANGNPAGTSADACKLSVFKLTDGVGNDMTTYEDPYHVELGLFEFYYTPLKSGCEASAGVGYGGHKVGNMLSIFTLLPQQIDHSKVTSSCAKLAGTAVQCNVTKRDQYDNVIGTCVTQADGTISCT